jgi:D-alanyl-D-alanine carboxypeptidase
MRGLRVAAAVVVGALVGGAITLAAQGRGASAPNLFRGPEAAAATFHPTGPNSFLAWVQGSLPRGLGARTRGLAGVGRVATVAENNVWLTRSWAPGGTVVDRPPRSFAIPLDVAAVDPSSFASFLPPADRDMAGALERGEGILGASSAELRGLGIGAVLRFSGGVTVTIAGVLPDESVGASELMVSRATGSRMGVSTVHYELVQPARGARLTAEGLAARLRGLMPPGLGPWGRVRVRAPGDTPYFRAGDASLPPVLLKTLFGEFAARPDASHPGYLQLDPSWIRHHVQTVVLPLLGRVTCNRAVIPALRGAMRALVRRGLGSLVHTYDGCLAPRFINRDPMGMISHHTWGVAIDINAADNPFGAPPHQDPRLVGVMRRWGFTWGGAFTVPDGNHFEYRRPPDHTG